MFTPCSYRALPSARGALIPTRTFEQPTRYELVLNRKTAMSFGVTIPSMVIQRADRVID